MHPIPNTGLLREYVSLMTNMNFQEVSMYAEALYKVTLYRQSFYTDTGPVNTNDGQEWLETA